MAGEDTSEIGAAGRTLVVKVISACDRSPLAHEKYTLLPRVSCHARLGSTLASYSIRKMVLLIDWRNRRGHNNTKIAYQWLPVKLGLRAVLENRIQERSQYYWNPFEKLPAYKCVDQERSGFALPSCLIRSMALLILCTAMRCPIPTITSVTLLPAFGIGWN